MFPVTQIYNRKHSCPPLVSKKISGLSHLNLPEICIGWQAQEERVMFPSFSQIFPKSPFACPRIFFLFKPNNLHFWHRDEDTISPNLRRLALMTKTHRFCCCETKQLSKNQFLKDIPGSNECLFWCSAHKRLMHCFRCESFPSNKFKNTWEYACFSFFSWQIIEVYLSWSKCETN